MQHVKAAERLDRCLDHVYNARLVRDVDLNSNSPAEFAGHALGLNPVDIGDHDRRTLTRHQARGGLTDAAAGARDDRGLALETPHCSRLTAGSVHAVRSASIDAVSTRPATARTSFLSEVTKASACSCVSATYSASYVVSQPS